MKSEKFNKNTENKQKFPKKEEEPAFKVETIEEKIDQETVFQKIKNQLGEDLLLPIKKELENLQITKEAVNLENKKIEILKNEIESLNKEIETTIENDLSQTAFSNNQEKSKFIKQITQKLRELTPKIPKKKIVYAATSSIMILSLLQSAGPKLKAETPQYLEPQDLESLILEDLSREKLDIENAESLFDLEHSEDETFFYSPNTFTDNYFKIKPPVSTTPSLATTTPTPVFTPTPQTPEFIKATTLEQDLNKIIEQAPGEWGVYIKEIGSDKFYGINEKESFHPASTIKIPIALEFFNFIEQENLNTQEILKQIPSGQSQNFERLLEDMLIKSDESATQIITDYLNKQPNYNVNKILNSWGFENTTIIPRSATPEELGMLLENFYSGKLELSQENKEIILKLLSTPSKDDFSRLGAPLPENLSDSYYHKIGTILGDDEIFTVSDIGIVNLKNGTSYVIVGLGKLENDSQYNQGVATLQNISGAALKAFSQEYYEKWLEKQNSSTVFIDKRYSNIGRLYNLLIAGERLNGIIIPAHQTVILSDIALKNLNEYLTGYAYNGENGTALGGGICGLAASLAKEAQELGLTWKSQARHFPTDHAAGGLYDNLPNASFASGKEFSITNNSDQDFIIKFYSNYTLDDIPKSLAWDEYLDPQQTIGQEEFKAGINLEKLESQKPDIQTSTKVFIPTPEISEKSIENQEIKLETIASAQYTNKEYFESTVVNLDLAVKYLNEYFEKNSLKPTDSQGFSFSYNEAMKYFEPEAGWQQTTGLIGSGACDIATLMYRAIKDFSSKIGSDLIKIDRDNVGHDIEQNELFTVRKINHTPYSGMPKDEISVNVVSKTNRWNSDFEIKINSQFSNGKEVPDNLEIRFLIFKDEQENYIAQILSNYSLEELQELAR